MYKENLLLTLLIHQHSQENYYKKHSEYVEKQKKIIEQIWKIPFTDINEERRIYYLSGWFWAPWRYNNIAGFGEIIKETDWTLIGNLYLPKGRYSPKKGYYLNYACASCDFEDRNIDSLRKAIIEISKQFKQIIKPKRWILEVDETIINHTDFFALLEERQNLNEKQTH